MRLLQLSCDLQTLNLALIYCHTNSNFVHINFLCLSQVIFQDFLLKDQFPVPVSYQRLTESLRRTASMSPYLAYCLNEFLSGILRLQTAEKKSRMAAVVLSRC